jgi:uncharacterized membrane protein YgcG
MNKYLTFGLIVVVATIVYVHHVQAASYVTRISNTISTSAPATSTNQTILFTLAQAIPAGGAIEISFTEGGFTIPGTFNFTDVDVGFSATEGGPYTPRPLSSVQSAGTDGVTVTSGAAGLVRIDLSTSIGIPASNQVQVLLGTNAGFEGDGDVQFVTSSATGSHPVTLTTYDAVGVEIDYGRTMIALIEQVGVGPVDTTDTIPPVVLSAEPTGIIQTGTVAVELYLTTDEPAECRWATSSMAYAVMPYQFYGTSTGLVTQHFYLESGLVDSVTYPHYVRCVDFRLNEIDPDYYFEFTVGIPPGSATTTSTSTASSTGSTGNCTGPDCVGDDPDGTGSGSTGSGDGSSSGDGSGGGSGGSSGDGTNLPLADVRIDGWAYPGSTVSFFRDGTVADTKSVSSDAAFSSLTEGLDRGSYTFGVYAVDKDGIRSATFSTTLWLRSDTLNVLGNVMLPPTISVVENSVSPGAPLDVYGYTAPNAEVTVFLRPRLAEVSTADVVETTTALSDGSWSLSLPTTSLPQGTYEVLAQAMMPDGLVESDKSARKTVGVGVTVDDTDCGRIGDLNCDGFVNLVDFSILLFNWETTNEIADINEDGFVSLPDFSVMLYYWTG